MSKVQDRKIFFDSLRGTALFRRFTTRQVQGIEALLDECEARDVPLHYTANILANVYRETGGGMYPIKETVFPHHRDKNPSDAEVIRRLDRAWENGQLPWVTVPYWRGGAFGRGQLQITHDYNYAKFGITNYAAALQLPVSARIAVQGMLEGMFTGKRLSDYTFPRDMDNPPRTDPRRIVNGIDGSDDEVQRNHMIFAGALASAGMPA